METLGHRALAFLELEYCEGGDLHDLILGGRAGRRSADGRGEAPSAHGRERAGRTGSSGLGGGGSGQGSERTGNGVAGVVVAAATRAGDIAGLPAAQIGRVALGLCEGLQRLHEVCGVVAWVGGWVPFCCIIPAPLNWVASVGFSRGWSPGLCEGSRVGRVLFVLLTFVFRGWFCSHPRLCPGSPLLIRTTRVPHSPHLSSPVGLNYLVSLGRGIQTYEIGVSRYRGLPVHHFASPLGLHRPASLRLFSRVLPCHTVPQSSFSTTATAPKYTREKYICVEKTHSLGALKLLNSQ